MSAIAINRCLVLPQKSIEMILAGTKTWVLNKRPTSVRGVIGLMDRETGVIHGTTEITGCHRKPFLTLSSLSYHFELHRVSDEDIKKSRGGCCFPWVVGNPVTLESTVPCEKPRSDALWVNGLWNL